MYENTWQFDDVIFRRFTLYRCPQNMNVPKSCRGPFPASSSLGALRTRLFFNFINLLFPKMSLHSLENARSEGGIFTECVWKCSHRFRLSQIILLGISETKTMCLDILFMFPWNFQLSAEWCVFSRVFQAFSSMNCFYTTQRCGLRCLSFWTQVL